MKRIFVFYLTAIVFAAMLCVGCGHTLFDGAESQYSIVLCDDASISEQTAAEDEDEQMRHRVDLVNLQILYLYMMRQPHEALEDGTRDYVFDFIRRHNIRVIEWNSVENYINWYNATYLGIKSDDRPFKVPLER